MYIHLDLSNADEPIKILAQAAAELPPLDADVNINYNNSSYDLELAIFTVSSAVTLCSAEVSCPSASSVYDSE